MLARTFIRDPVAALLTTATQSSGLSGRSGDKPELFKRYDHLMDRRRRDFEVSLHFCFRWRTAIYPAVVVDERKVLPLLRVKTPHLVHLDPLIGFLMVNKPSEPSIFAIRSMPKIRVRKNCQPPDPKRR
jgi:hypothetical protein